jgi:DNA-binding transcriptional MerR regulator
MSAFNYFTIKDIENLCDIKAHTLRMWELRYNMFKAKRKESKHRIYDNEDLKELLKISFLYHHGYKISKIASLSAPEIEQLIQEYYKLGDTDEVFILRLMEAGVDFNKEKFEKIISLLVLRLGIDKCIKDVFFPFLQRVGMMWMTNHVIPAQEHFVSHIIRKKIILAIDGLDTTYHLDNNILIFAPTGEFHEIPLLVTDYFFKKYNNHTTYLGVNVSPDCIRSYLLHRPVSFFYSHITTPLDNCYVEEYFRKLAKNYPDKPIYISGPAVKCIINKSENLKILHSMDEMLSLANQGSHNN